jgi:starch phosphorylase
LEEENLKMVAIHPDFPNHFSLPRRISRLGQLAYNLWWVWNPEGQMVFSQIDKPLWERINHNPVAFLHKVDRPRLNAMTNDRYYLDFYDRVMHNFDQYLKGEDTWFQRTYPDLTGKIIAYFSFEFGLHEALPVYAGGLGVLAGDYMKGASEVGMPLVAVGFVYNQGYFSQRITEDGWQETRNLMLNFEEMPIIPLLTVDNKPAMISVDLPGRKVWARLWTVKVGRVSLYLLDTNVDENSPADRQLTARLYSNDLEIRISQEILLGMGGVRALRLLGIQPDIWHMNEGHSAFLALERSLEYVAQGDTFEQAAEKVRRASIFTTNTPVPAGNDQFPMWLVDKYFSQIWPQLGLDHEQFIELGRQPQAWGDSFVMPVLALKLSERINAVSELHGQVSRKMWNFLWPDRRVDDVPIMNITNAIHAGTWLARRMRLLFDRYLGSDWLERQDDPETWVQIENIPDGELWAVRAHLKRKLLNFANDRIRQSWLSGQIHPVQVIAGGVMLEPYSLTIGFARRFATYKRGNLILRDIDRLMRLINNPEMPVQIIFAGKAHPADEPGKLIIQQVYRTVKDAKAGGRLVFLEDYDMNVARYLIQGVDVWMNTPRRPNEASGTSGMKAAINGVLHFSVLDGWWQEGYNGQNGFAIGDEVNLPDTDQQDDADAESLYDTLENSIIPLYYTSRTPEGLSPDWIARMKESIRTLAPQFTMRRMLKDYMTQLYLPALQETSPQPEETN